MPWGSWIANMSQSDVGSNYCYSKGFHSIFMLALAGEDYKFLWWTWAPIQQPSLADAS